MHKDGFDDEWNSDSDGAEGGSVRRGAPRKRGPVTDKCPYLDTVNREALDFDMAKVCSVTLSPLNVYACLVCGRFFQGRGRHTQAYMHSVEAGHHVWVNLADSRFYCLPDGYEIVDSSLDDVRAALQLSFTPEQLKQLDHVHTLRKDVSGNTYLPGYVGINNLKHTDYIASVVHALAHVAPLRDYFLVQSNYAHCRSPLVQRFGDLCRRIWSPAAFRATVSPHEFVNAVSDASARRFGAGQSVECMEFCVWLLNTLHKELCEAATAAAASASAVSGGGSASGNSASAASTAAGKRGRSDAVGPAKPVTRSIITDVFQGQVEVTTLSSDLAEEEAKEQEAQARAKAADEAGSDNEEAANAAVMARPARRRKLEEGPAASGGSGGGGGGGGGSAARFPQVSRVPFLFLSLDLPPAPLFRDSSGTVTIPQIPIYQLLSKYDGVTVTDNLRGQYRERKRYRVLNLPPYLMLHVKRFKKMEFASEKNPTVVNFPLRNLEMRPYCALGDKVSALAQLGAAPAPAAAMPTIDELPSDDAIAAMPASALKALLAKHDRPLSAIELAGMDRSELIKRVCGAMKAAREAAAAKTSTHTTGLDSKFDLVANVAHDSPPDTVAGTGTVVGSGAGAASTAAAPHDTYTQAGGDPGAGGNQAAKAVRVTAAASDPILRGHYRSHLVHDLDGGSGSSSGGGGGGAGTWYELQDLSVTEVLPQLIALSDSCILIYRRRAQ